VGEIATNNQELGSYNPLKKEGKRETSSTFTPILSWRTFSKLQHGRIDFK
jgi:hypothetical protein